MSKNKHMQGCFAKRTFRVGCNIDKIYAMMRYGYEDVTLIDSGEDFILQYLRTIISLL